MASLSILDKAGLEHGISFDMGGTSCDVAVTEGRSVEIRDRFDIDGRHICLPSVQVETLSLVEAPWLGLTMGACYMSDPRARVRFLVL